MGATIPSLRLIHKSVGRTASHRPRHSKKRRLNECAPDPSDHGKHSSSTPRPVRHHWKGPFQARSSPNLEPINKNARRSRKKETCQWYEDKRAPSASGSNLIGLGNTRCFSKDKNESPQIEDKQAAIHPISASQEARLPKELLATEYPGAHDPNGTRKQDKNPKIQRAQRRKPRQKSRRSRAKLPQPLSVAIKEEEGKDEGVTTTNNDRSVEKRSQSSVLPFHRPLPRSAPTAEYAASTPVKAELSGDDEEGLVVKVKLEEVCQPILHRSFSNP